MWQCPACNKRFAQNGQSHSCTTIALDEHFRDRPRVRELFDAFCRALEEVGGPFRLSVARTRIGIITGITFAAIMPRREFLRAHFLLTRRLDSDRFVRIDHFAPYFVHVLEIHDPNDLDAELRAWLKESYALASRP